MESYNEGMRFISFLSVCVAMSVVLTGCSSLGPVKSTPPAQIITLKAPAEKKGLFSKNILPAGDYKVTYEDKGGFYYQAPAKIIVKDIGSSLCDGGLYVVRGTDVPDHYYAIDPSTGIKHTFRFKTIPEYELKK